MNEVNFKKILKSLLDNEYIVGQLGLHPKGSKHENITVIGNHKIFIKYRPSKKVVVLRWGGKDAFIMQPRKKDPVIHIGPKKYQRNLFENSLKTRNIVPQPSAKQYHEGYFLFEFDKNVLDEPEFLDAITESISDLISS